MDYFFIQQINEYIYARHCSGIQGLISQQNKIVFLLEMSSQLARKEMPVLQNTCCGVMGFLHILVQIHPKEIQILFSNKIENFLLILLHRLHL